MIRAIIMASGFSRRLGRDKLLEDLGGKPVLRWVLEAVKTAGFQSVTVVWRNPAVEALGREMGAAVLENPEAEHGQSAGIRLAVSEAGPAEGFLFLAGDQPFILPETLVRIRSVWEAHPTAIVSAASEEGQRILPTLFPGGLREALLTLRGDTGARKLIEESDVPVLRVPVRIPQESWDIDTEEALWASRQWVTEQLERRS